MAPDEYNFMIFKIPLAEGTRNYMHRYVQAASSAAVTTTAAAILVSSVIIALILK